MMKRSQPHRPNPIGLSLVAIDSVDPAAGLVHFNGIDVIDGTPILDIKPCNSTRNLLDANLVTPHAIYLMDRVGRSTAITGGAAKVLPDRPLPPEPLDIQGHLLRDCL